MLKEAEQEKEEEKRRMDREEESQSVGHHKERSKGIHSKVPEATVFQIVML